MNDTTKQSRTENTLGVGEKLKEESTAAKVRKSKLRHDKADTSISAKEARKNRKAVLKGRKESARLVALEATARRQVVNNQDNNSGVDAANTTLAAAETAGVYAESAVRGKLSDRMYGKNLEDEDERGSNSLKDSGAARGKAEVDAPESKSETGASNAKSREANKKRMKKSSYGGEGKSEKSVADNAKEFLDKVREAVVNAATAVVETVASNPWVLIVVGVIAVLVLLCSFMLGSCGTFAGTMSDSTLVTTYTAYDEDITGVEKDYKKLEKEQKS